MDRGRDIHRLDDMGVTTQDPSETLSDYYTHHTLIRKEIHGQMVMVKVYSYKGGVISSGAYPVVRRRRVMDTGELMQQYGPPDRFHNKFFRLMNSVPA